MKILLFFFISATMTSQQLHHATIASQGGTFKSNSGVYISQSIGQNSIIGTSVTDNSINFQGFQQNMGMFNIKNNIPLHYTTAYPNPFSDIVYFKFSQAIKDRVQIQVFDPVGKLVLQKQSFQEDFVLHLDLFSLSPALYTVKFSAPNFYFIAKILKK